MTSTPDAANVGQAVNKAVGILARHAAAECTEQIRNPDGFLTDAGKRARATHGDQLETDIVAGMTAEEAAAHVRSLERSEYDRVLGRLDGNPQRPDNVSLTGKAQYDRMRRANEQRQAEADAWRRPDTAEERRIHAIITETRVKLRADRGVNDLQAKPEPEAQTG